MALVCREWHEIIHGPSMSHDYAFTFSYRQSVSCSASKALRGSTRHHQNLVLYLDPVSMTLQEDLNRALKTLVEIGTVRHLWVTGEPNLELNRFFQKHTTLMLRLVTLTVVSNVLYRTRTIGPELEIVLPDLKLLCWRYVPIGASRTSPVMHALITMDVPSLVSLSVLYENCYLPQNRLLKFLNTNCLEDITIPRFKFFTSDFLETKRPNLQNLHVQQIVRVETLLEMRSIVERSPKVKSIHVNINEFTFSVLRAFAWSHYLKEVTLSVNNFRFAHIMDQLLPLRNLEILKLDYMCTRVTNGNVHELTFPRMKHFSVHYLTTTCTKETVTISMPTLTNLELMFINRHTYKTLNVFCLPPVTTMKYNNLEKLTIFAIPHFMEFIRKQPFPNLTSLDLSVEEIDDELLACFDDRIKRLKYLSVSFRIKEDHHMLIAKICQMGTGLYTLVLRNAILGLMTIETLNILQNLRELHLIDSCIVGSVRRYIKLKWIHTLRIKCVVVNNDELDKFCIESRHDYSRSFINKHSINNCEEPFASLKQKCHMEARLDEVVRQFANM